MPKKRPGDRMEIGDTLGHPQEPYERWARLVGYCHTCVPIKSCLVRCYRDGDGRWPTGEYRTTSPVMVIAWMGEESDAG